MYVNKLRLPFLAMVDSGTESGGGTPPVPSPADMPSKRPTEPAADRASPVEPPAPALGAHGYPEGVAIADMTPEQQVAYWRFHAQKHEKTLRATQKELNEKGSRVTELEDAARTDAEKAIEQARREGEQAGRAAAAAEARTTYGTQLVETRLDAAAAAKGMTPEQIRALAGDATRFLGADGVDADALTAFLGALPDKAADPTPAPRDLGGGRRQSANTSGVQKGLDGYAEKFGRRKTNP